MIATADREHELEFAEKVREAKTELQRIKSKKTAVDTELEGRENELQVAFGLFCGLTQSQIRAMDSFTAEDLKYRLKGFLEVFGLVAGTVETAFDKNSGQVSVRFTYTPEGADAPIASHEYTFDLN